MKIQNFLVPVVCLGVIGYILFTGPEPKSTSSNIVYGADPSENKDKPFSYEDYGIALKTYVDKKGMVNYARLKENRGKLDAFSRALARLDKKEYEKWDEKGRIAFWINAYNGLTLQAIIDNYPIKGGWSIRFPKNSIRRIKGVWTKLQFPVMGEPMTLDEIEHKTLRAKFSEPRIHMALVCAALGCPSLRNEPYEGKKLDQQLDDQTKKFLAHGQKFKIDKDKNEVYVSKIFSWFGSDFVKKYTPRQGFSDLNKTERAFLYYISKYLEKSDSDYLRDRKYKIKYFDYDWSLNEQKKKKT